MSRFSREVFHKGTREYEANQRAKEFLRAEGLKNNPPKPLAPLAERQAKLLEMQAKRKEEEKIKRNENANKLRIAKKMGISPYNR